MIYKIGSSLLAIIGFVIASIWIYNHINPWVGILVGAFGTMFIIDKIIKTIKNQNKNEN
jgi:hypothetical protein